ncbi:MAG: polysaccharide biosynthesis tyrosine autokinase [Akkermansiaceae bacterium]
MHNTNQAEAAQQAIDYWQILKNRYGVILLTFLLVFLTAAVITYVMPKKYESIALVEVKPIVDIDPTHGGSKGGIGAQMSRQFINTQFEVIVAPETLNIAIDDIQLEARWGQDRKSVLAQLRSIVRTNQRRGTDLIEISVRHAKKAEAQAIAKAVYEAYRVRREALEMGIRTDHLKALKIELMNQNDRITLLRKKVEDLAEKHGLIFVEDEKGGKTIGSMLPLKEQADRDLYDARRERDEIFVQIKKLLGVEQSHLIAVAAELPDVGFKEDYRMFEEAKRDLERMLASGLGKKHPDIMMRQRLLAGLEENLTQKANHAKTALNHKLDIIDKRVQQLEAVVERYQSQGTEKSRGYSEYNMARHEYDKALELKEGIERTYHAEKTKTKLNSISIQVHEEPEINDNPVSPNVPMNLALGAVVGLIFGAGIAFFLEYMDTSVKSLEDVERFLQVSVLAVIPRDVGVLHKQSGLSPDAEAYRILRTNIEFNRKNPDDNAITVVSGGAGEGKSTTLVNLAYVCAQGGYTTLMIDADLRRPRLHTFFDISNSVGLTNYLTTDLMLEDVVIQTPVDNLYFMPSGILPADAAGILNSRRMSELIQDVKQRFDLVLIDSPPILGVSDASVLASEVDLTMIVVQHRKLPRNMLVRVKQAVENVGGHVVGVVLNNVDVRSDNQYQYYTSYYTYYAPTTGEEIPSESQRQPSAQLASANHDEDEDLY